jgi:basic amino acid/polyamine antiporter, APA family
MTAPATLKRTLSLVDLVLIAMGTVIGSGIYLVAGPVLQQTGLRTDVAMYVWIGGGVLSLLGALTYAELGAMRPSAGGLYVFIRDAFGPLPAFLYGWTSFFVIASGSVAALSVAFAQYLTQIVALSPLQARVVSVAVIVVTAALNAAGTRRSATVQNWTTGLKVGAVLVMGVALMVLGDPAPQAAVVPTLTGSELASGFGTAMISVLWAYEGWQYVTFSAGETIDAQRVFPRAITAAAVALIVTYLVANFGYVAALGPQAIAASDHVAADAVSAVFGRAAGSMVGALILVSIFSATNGLMLTAPRMYYAMAGDGVFFRRLAEVHPRFGTPMMSIAALATWAALLAVSGTFTQLLTYVVFTGWIFYGLGGLAVIVLRRRQPHAIRPFYVPGYPATPVLFVASALLLVLNTMLAQPARSALGVGAVLLGAPAYYLWRTRSPRAPVVPTPALRED